MKEGSIVVVHVESDGGLWIGVRVVNLCGDFVTVMSNQGREWLEFTVPVEWCRELSPV